LYIEARIFFIAAESSRLYGAKRDYPVLRAPSKKCKRGPLYSNPSSISHSRLHTIKWKMLTGLKNTRELWAFVEPAA